MISLGMFISKEGQYIIVPQSHIAMVIAHPGDFGLTKEEIQQTYDKYGEKLGVEGKARLDILTKAILNGWIRLRRYSDHQWSITVDDQTKRTEILKDWACKITAGAFGENEKDLHLPVVITSLATNRIYTTTIIDLML